MSLQKYNALLKTVELGSISQAAEQMGYGRIPREPHQSCAGRLLYQCGRYVDTGISALLRPKTPKFPVPRNFL